MGQKPHAVMVVYRTNWISLRILYFTRGCISNSIVGKFQLSVRTVGAACDNCGTYPAANGRVEAMLALHHLNVLPNRHCHIVRVWPLYQKVCTYQQQVHIAYAQDEPWLLDRALRWTPHRFQPLQHQTGLQLTRLPIHPELLLPELPPAPLIVRSRPPLVAGGYL